MAEFRLSRIKKGARGLDESSPYGEDLQGFDLSNPDKR